MVLYCFFCLTQGRVECSELGEDGRCLNAVCSEECSGVRLDRVGQAMEDELFSPECQNELTVGDLRRLLRVQSTCGSHTAWNRVS